MTRTKIPIPLQGLSDDDAFSEQAPGTTREAVNVRGICPITGRTRLSQRAGSSKFIADQVCSTKLDAVVPITYDLPRMDYRQETADFEVDWSVSVPPGNGSHSVRTDRQGNVFVAAVNGTVYKYNSAGELVDTIVPPLPAGFSAVRVIRLDEIDALYMAGTVKTGEYQGYVWKFVPDEDSDGNTVYRQQWAIARTTGIVDFDVRGGLLAILGDGISLPEDPCRIAVYASVNAYAPYALWEKVAPTPGNAIRINSSGDVVVTCEPNPDRGYTGSAAGAWSAENIEWSPHEEYESSTRLHGWVDAKQVLNHADGEELETWEDRRWIATQEDNPLSPSNHLQYGQPGATDSSDSDAHTNEPTDIDPSRYLYNSRFVAQGSVSLSPPKFRVGAHGEFPSLEFDAYTRRELEAGEPDHQSWDVTGCRLLMRPGIFPFKDASSQTDPTASGTNPNYSCFLPGHDPFNVGASSTTGYGNGFCFFLSGVLTDDTKPQVIWSTTKAINGGRIEYAFLANVYNSSGTWKYLPGCLGMYVEKYTASGQTISWEWKRIDRSSWDRTGRGFFVFTFVHGGTDRLVAGSTRDDESVFRVNGIHVKRFDDMGMRQTLGTSTPPYFRSTLGGAGVMAGPTTNEGVCPAALMGVVQDVGNPKELYRYSFHGHLFEAITLLHPNGGAGSTANSLATNTEFPLEVSALEWGDVQPHDGGDVPDTGTTATGSIDPGDYSPGAADDYTKSATTVERFEGYMAHGYGAPDALPDPDGAKTGYFWNAHPFGGTRVPDGAKNGYNGYEATSSKNLSSPNGILAKYAGGSGKVIWATTASGIGYGLTFDDDDHVVCIGPLEDATSVDVMLRKVRDDGPSVGLTGANTWTVDSATTEDESDTRLIRMASDSNGDAYWPVYDGFYDGTTSVEALRKYDQDDGTELLAVTLDEPVIPFGVAFPPTVPIYDDDTITGPEFCYICTSGGSSNDQSTLYKVRLVHADQNVADGQTLRRTDVVTVGGGDIKVVSDGTLSTPTGGSGALLVRTPYVQATQLFGEVFITDGTSYKVYNPRTGIVSDFTATDGGELPERARILTAWRGRIILSRAADDPYEIYASELGNPYGWDIYPGAPSASQAWKGRTAGVGRAPDIVNAFIPMTDDLALIGGDHSIFRMTGDPAAGGNIDVLTDQVGVAFGGSWTKDPGGNLYFFGSRGGVFVLGTSGWTRLSEKRIERRLQDLDLEEYQVRLVWDYRREGLMVIPVPWTIGGVKHSAWFWEAKTGAWWEDDWTDAGVQPSCACIVDGDRPDDRMVLFGCEDGYLRQVDEDATDDDTARIDARALVGPLVPPGTDSLFRFMRPAVVLASDQDGAEYELYAGQTADAQGSPWAAGSTVPGRSGFLTGRTRGAAVWFRLKNNQSGERFAVEDATIDVAPAGRAR